MAADGGSPGGDRAEQDVGRVGALFSALIQHAPDIIGVLDRHGSFRYVNAAIERMLGRRPDALIGLALTELVHPHDRLRWRGSQRLLTSSAGRAGDTTQVQLRLRHLDGRWLRLDTLMTNQLDDPNVAGILIYARDVSERVALEERLQRDALHDPLTGLPNRAAFMDRVEHALATAARRGTSTAVVFLDLDWFKQINDTLGHAAGDDVLVETGRRLRSCLRASDTVARLGGDEFTVLLEGIEGTADAVLAADRMLQALARPYAVAVRSDTEAVELRVTASAGVAVGGPGRGHPHDLLRSADVAMYRAKAEGKARHRVFEPSMAIE